GMPRKSTFQCAGIRGLYCRMKSNWNSLSSSAAHASLLGNSFFSAIISSKRSASSSFSTSSSLLLPSSRNEESTSDDLGESCFLMRQPRTRFKMRRDLRLALPVLGVSCLPLAAARGVAMLGGQCVDFFSSREAQLPLTTLIRPGACNRCVVWYKGAKQFS